MDLEDQLPKKLLWFGRCVGSLLGSSEFISTHILKLSKATYAGAKAIHFSIYEKEQVLLGEFKTF